MRLCKTILLFFFSTTMIYGKQTSTDIIQNEKKDQEMENGIVLHGGLEIFNKTAFNVKQLLPNNSYGYVLGQLSIGYNYNNFEFMVGAVAAGLTYDSTKEGLGFNYIGAYPGYFNNIEATADNTHKIFVHNAFIKYQTDNSMIKVGRFEQENDDWFDSYAEGLNAIFKFANNYHIKLFGSSAIALVGNGWLTDFSTAYSTYGIVNAEFGYKNDLFNTEFYVYYGYNEYTAPGINLEFTLGNKDYISYNTKVTTLFPIHSKNILKIGNHFFADFQNPIGFTSSILLRQDINIFDRYKIALAVYKNIGNANARIGMFGNPIGIDIWDNSVYETGASLNASVAPDALSILLFTQAKYNNIATFVKNISFQINGRYTTAPSATDYSLKFICDWQVLDNVNIGIIANYYTHIIQHDAWNNSNYTILEGKHILDRSYIMTSINYAF